MSKYVEKLNQINAIKNNRFNVFAAEELTELKEALTAHRLKVITVNNQLRSDDPFKSDVGRRLDVIRQLCRQLDLI